MKSDIQFYLLAFFCVLVAFTSGFIDCQFKQSVRQDARVMYESFMNSGEHMALQATPVNMEYNDCIFYSVTFRKEIAQLSNRRHAVALYTDKESKEMTASNILDMCENNDPISLRIIKNEA